jgi:hypothetical protein
MIDVGEHGEPAQPRKDILEQLDSLAGQLERQEGGAGEIGPGLREALDDTQCHGIAALGEQHRDVRDPAHGARRRPAGHGEIDVAALQLRDEPAQPLGIAGRIV